MVPHLTSSKKRILMNDFFKSQCYYCPLIWICCNRFLSNKINRLHKRCLPIWYSTKKNRFCRTSRKRWFCLAVHHQDSRFLATKMFEAFIDISPQIAKEIFQFRNAVPYQLKKQTDFQILSSHRIFSSTIKYKVSWSKNLGNLPHEIN